MIKDVNPQQSKNIKELFLYGSVSVGSFMRSLARELFGEERIVATLLGEDGEFLKGIKMNQDRHQLFSVEEEMKIIETLKIIDADFFTKRDVYRVLVRDKINSFGRDLKKSMDLDKSQSTSNRKSTSSSKSYNITSYFKKISRAGNQQDLVKDNSDEPVAGPSGQQQRFDESPNTSSYETPDRSDTE